MSDKIKLVQNDTRPALVVTITDDTTGNPIDMTGSTLALKFRQVGSSSLQATVAGIVTGGTSGQVTFFPSTAPEMLAGTPGDYEGEIQITFPDGQIQTVYDTLKFKVRQEF